MGTGESSERPDEMLGGSLAIDWPVIQGGVVILFMLHENQDKLRLSGR